MAVLFVGLTTLANRLEFDFRTLGDGRSAAVRYANNSNYRNDSLIRKESECSDASKDEDYCNVTDRVS